MPILISKLFNDICIGVEVKSDLHFRHNIHNMTHKSYIYMKLEVSNDT